MLLVGRGGVGWVELVSRLGIDRAINLLGKAGGGGCGVSGLPLFNLLDELH